jgi:hypothetical protein
VYIFKADGSIGEGTKNNAFFNALWYRQAMSKRETSVWWRVFAIISAVVAMTGKFNAIITVAFLCLAAILIIIDIYKRDLVRSPSGGVVWWKMGLSVICVCLAFSLFGWWIWPTTVTEVQEQPSIYQLPSLGNLKERTLALVDEIITDLYIHGWDNPRLPLEQQEKLSNLHVFEEIPSNGDGVLQWARERSNYFKFRFFERALNIRNEFAQLHIRDQRLDDFFKHQGMIEAARRQLAPSGKTLRADILPQTIQEVAERLRFLTTEIEKNRID